MHLLTSHPLIRFVLFLSPLSASALDSATGLLPWEVAPQCDRVKGSVPRADLPAGIPNAEFGKIEHIFVMMQENRSFDHFYGKLSDKQYYGDAVDGLKPGLSNLDSKGNKWEPFHLTNFCLNDVDHEWDGSISDWNRGAQDRFVANNDGKKLNGSRAIGYYNASDLAYHYALANKFAIGDRYFASVMGPTHPNRFFLLAGTAFGHTDNRLPHLETEWDEPTIFETLNQYGVSWKYYYVDVPALFLFQPTMKNNKERIRPISEFYKDVKNKKLPSVVFMDTPFLEGAEHPPFNFQMSQQRVAKRINTVMASEYWKKSAIFLTYDEGGGFYDHVAPPPACIPDERKPELPNGRVYAEFDRLGFRVPFVVISPFAKKHFVSHEVYDHSSVLKFIESKYNLPALSRRDANANDLSDFFDFNQNNFAAPQLPKFKINWGRYIKCLFTKKFH